MDRFKEGYPEPHILPWSRFETLSKVDGRNRRVVSVADVHGDYEGLVSILQKSGLLLRNNSTNETFWVGGNAILVQTGDLIDRGNRSADVLRLMAKLQLQAKEKDGRVVILMGNHELMNLMEMSEDELKFSSFLPFIGEFGCFVRSFSLVTVVDTGDVRILFVHGGLTDDFLHGEHPIEDLNDQFSDYTSMIYLRSQSDEKLLSWHGPMWSRFFALETNESSVCSALESTLRLADADKMVVGHTVQPRSQVTTRCKGRLILGDVGFSPYYYGHRIAIEHFPNGTHKVIEDNKVDPSLLPIIL